MSALLVIASAVILPIAAFRMSAWVGGAVVVAYALALADIVSPLALALAGY